MPRAPATLLVGQSGGPTAVINASLAGVVLAARCSPAITRVLGLRHGIEGLLRHEIVDLGAVPLSTWARLRLTPAAALGSCRYRLSDNDLAPALEALRRLQVRYFCYIGGNDSADTAYRLSQAARAAGYELVVVGVPKTIDNDLPATDHCPGYGSAARFVALAARDAALDTAAMARVDPVKILEVQGRRAGWIAAAAALGRARPEDPPHLIYLPERPVSLARALADIAEVHAATGHCVVVMSENQPDERGAVLGSDGTPTHVDAFGHAYYESPAAALARAVRSQLGLRVRIDRPGTIARTLSATVSTVDRREAEQVGRAAVRLALRGEGEVMVTLVRQADEPYRCTTATAPLPFIANGERLLPDDFIAASGHDVTAAFLDYARPLIGPPLPPIARLEAPLCHPPR